jgi:hypothetical protein
MEVGGGGSGLDHHLVERAAEFWRRGAPYEAGQVIFENLPNEVRPKWAARILRLVLTRSGVQPSHFEGVRPKWAARVLRSVLAAIGVRSMLFEHVLHIADHPWQWGRGHRVFDKLRDSLLWLETQREMLGLTKKQKLLESLLDLAELVAKVTYNATDPPDPFDEDAGWRIAAQLRAFVERFDDEEFSEAAWSALCFREE